MADPPLSTELQDSQDSQDSPLPPVNPENPGILSNKRARRPWSWLALLAFAAAAALAAVNVWFGPLNQDEGWYLLAAQNVSRGMMPYRDFLYSQGPVLPWVYGAFSGVWSPGGVLGGRILTAAIGLLAALFFSGLAGALAGRRDRAADWPAFLLSLVLLALSPDWSYFTAIPKTYALGSAFLALGFVLGFAPALVSVREGRRLAPALAGVCFALAAATRATLCLAAVPVWIALIVLARRDRARRFDWLLFAIGCAVALALVYGPFLAICPENLLFAQALHTARNSAPLGEWLVLRAGFLCLLAQGYPAMVAAAAILAAAPVFRTREAGGPAGHADASRVLYLAVVAAFALLTLAHFLVPFPYADYNVPAMPLAAVALAVPLGRLVARSGLRPWRVGLAALAASLAFVAASPWPMKWVDGEQRLFWFRSDLDSALARLRRAGRAVREANPAGKPLLTQEAYLAVEAGAGVVPGLEIGPFSLFPALSDDEARAHRVHNVATLEEAIRTCDADVAALSGYSFLIALPTTEPLPEADRERLLAAVRQRFPDVVRAEPRFGQQNTPLEVRTRPASSDPSPEPCPH